MSEIVNDVTDTLKMELSELEFDLDDIFQQRSVGDKIEGECYNVCKSEFGDKCKEASSKRSIEDFMIVDDNVDYYFDVKTHYINDEGFSMPNLISIDRLRKDILQYDNRKLLYIFVDYSRDFDGVSVEHIEVKHIWELDWSILGIGSLGWGQLQIKNANNDLVFTDIGRDEWFDLLNERALEFYEKRIGKIQKKIVEWS